MNKWFEDKLQNKRIRSYTKKRIDTNPFNRMLKKYSLTNWIIIINLIVFLVLLILISVFDIDYFESTILPFIALQPDLFFKGNIIPLFVHMFVHIDIGHLLANMISLFFIGNFVEKLIGRKRFFWLYLFSGLFAGLFYVNLAYFFGVPVLDPSVLSFGNLEWLRHGLFGSTLIFAVNKSIIEEDCLLTKVSTTDLRNLICILKFKSKN